MPNDLTTQLQDIQQLLCLLEYFKSPPPKPEPPPRNWDLWRRAVTEVGSTEPPVYDGRITSADRVIDYTLNGLSVVKPVYRRLDTEYDKADKKAHAEYAREFAANRQEADHLFVCIKATIQRFTELPFHKVLGTYRKAIESLTCSTTGLSWVIRDLKHIKAKIEFHISRGIKPVSAEEIRNRLMPALRQRFGKKRPSQRVPRTATPPPAPVAKQAEIDPKAAGEKAETVSSGASTGIASKGGKSEHDDEDKENYYKDESEFLKAIGWKKHTVDNRVSEARKNPDHWLRGIVVFNNDTQQTVKGYLKSGVLEYRARRYGTPKTMRADEAFGKPGVHKDDEDGDRSPGMQLVVPGKHPRECAECGATGVKLKHVKAEFEKPDGKVEPVWNSYCLGCYANLTPEVQAAFHEYEAEDVDTTESDRTE